jgi:hypothetical protein
VVVSVAAAEVLLAAAELAGVGEKINSGMQFLMHAAIFTL